MHAVLGEFTLQPFSPAYTELPCGKQCSGWENTCMFSVFAEQSALVRPEVCIAMLLTKVTYTQEKFLFRLWYEEHPFKLVRKQFLVLEGCEIDKFINTWIEYAPAACCDHLTYDLIAMQFEIATT